MDTTEIDVEERARRLGTWSLIAGIVGLFISPVAIPAIVLSYRQPKGYKTGMGRAGFILDVIGCIAWGIMAAFFGWAIWWA